MRERVTPGLGRPRLGRFSAKDNASRVHELNYQTANVPIDYYRNPRPLPDRDECVVLVAFSRHCNASGPTEGGRLDGLDLDGRIERTIQVRLIDNKEEPARSGINFTEIVDRDANRS